ncbi:hypothetical protein LNV23_05520 [Paucibacter sp. DJ1R-11]|uniref:hypothetical protein n=1 Tax=Paucibacter sp. DJ1R-11 TaxID=2893556 RepID=UPI0021E48A99|nr:hypothetical protein [Paucibacter sp. DJ1R-11]MCV2362910.1 hypothetical protein [Paucibacter sp. DJ1R-11]
MSTVHPASLPDTSPRPSLLAMAALLGLALHAPAHADGLSDLKSALQRLQGQTPVKAQLEVKTLRRSGEGKELDEDQGAAVISVEDGSRGLQLIYSKDLLARSEAEERAKTKDSKSKSPTTLGLGELKTSDVRHMLSAASHLARQIDEANFRSEKADNYKGSPARLLSFEVPMERIPEKERKYIKKFESQMEVWIAADGTPLGLRSQSSFGGRAYMVFSFEGRAEDERSYSVVGDRLITVRQETRTGSSGTAGNSDSKVLRSLQIQS